MRVHALCIRSYVGIGGVGGAEKMIHSLLGQLVRDGWSASASAFGRPRDHAVVDGVDVYRRRTDTDISDLVSKADILICHLGSTGTAKELGRRFGKPVVQLIHNTNEYTQGFLGSGCDFALYNSEWVKGHLESNKPGIIRDVTSKVSYQLRRRAQLEWPSLVVHPPVLSGAQFASAGPDGYVTLINMVPNKGPDVFYDLAERNPDVKFRGVIGGYEEDAQVIRQLPNVEIHPHTSDMNKIFSEASVVVMPSIYESYGLAAVEGLQYGVPVIAAPTPGLREALGPSGWYREREDLDGWNSALRSTLDNHDARSAEAYTRHRELFAQSETELAEFSTTMTEIANGSYRGRGHRDSDRDTCRV